MVTPQEEQDDDIEDDGFVFLEIVNRAMPDIIAEIMRVVGYIVIAQDGWIVKKHSDGRIEKLKELERVERPAKINWR